MAGGRLSDVGLERDGRQVVALVDHDQAVVAEERVEVVDGLEALDHREVDDPGEFASSAADLADLFRGESEQRLELCSPLLEERLAVGEDERRQPPRGDRGAGDHGLARSRRGDEDTIVVREHGGQGCLLKRRKRPGESQRQRVVRRAAVVDHEPASGRRDRDVELFAEPARQLQVRQRLVVTADQPRCLMGRESQPLAFVEERVVDRGEVLELGKKCRRQARLRDREVGPDRAADLRRQPPIPASRVCLTIAAGPTGTSSLLARRASSCSGGSRSSELSRAHWSGTGSNVAGSRKTLVPASRHLPWSGSAIRFPNPFWGRKS